MSQDDSEKKDTRSRRAFFRMPSPRAEPVVRAEPTQVEPEKTETIEIKTDNTPIKLNEYHLKELEPITNQILSFEENANKTLSVIDKKIFPGKLGSLGDLEKSSRMIVKIMEESIRHKILDVDAVKYLKAIENGYLDIDQEIRDVSNVSIITQGLLINDIDIRIDRLIQSERTYIISLEEELRVKEEAIKLVQMLLEQYHK